MTKYAQLKHYEAFGMHYKYNEPFNNYLIVFQKWYLIIAMC